MSSSILQRIIGFCLYILILISPLLCFKVFTHPSMIPKAIFIEVVGGFMLICWMVSLNLQKDRRVVLSPLVPPVCMLIVVFILSLIKSDYLYGGVFELLNFIVFFLLYLLMINYFESHRQMDRVFTVSTITAVIVSVIGISQYYGSPLIDLPQDHPPGATFYYKNMAAQYIIMIIPLSAYLLISGKKRWLRVYSFLATIIMITFLYCTGSRASSLGLLSGLIIAGIFQLSIGGLRLGIKEGGKSWMKGLHISRLLFIIVLIYFLVSLPGYITRGMADPSKVRSVNTRLSLWVNTIEMIKDNPILGIGLGGWKGEYPLYHNARMVTRRFSEREQPLRAHNEYLQLTAEAGIVGLTVCVWMIFIVFRMLWRVCRYGGDRETRLKGFFFTMSLSALLANALFSFPFRLPVSSFFFVLILGMLTVLYHGQGDVRVIQIKKPAIITMVSVVITILIVYVIFLKTSLAMAEVNYYQAQLYAVKGDLKTALQKAERARDIYPHHYRIRLYCGVLYLRAGRYDEAIEENLAALRLRPHDTSAHNNLGIAYFSKGYYEEAIKEYEAKLRILPGSLGALKNLARVYIRLGELDKAAGVYKEAISYHPDNAYLHFILGAIYAREGDIEDAIREMEEAVKLDPDNDTYRLNLEGLYNSFRR